MLVFSIACNLLLFTLLGTFQTFLPSHSAVLVLQLNHESPIQTRSETSVVSKEQQMVDTSGEQTDSQVGIQKHYSHGCIKPDSMRELD